MNTPILLGAPTPTTLIIILVIVLLLFGAKKLPELARGLGKSLNEFKKAKNEYDEGLSGEEEKDKEKQA